ncbi:MAG: PAS domain S-box protein [Tenuifilaceae bacterium]|jgi:PAS domain S-box-containing protein|nr:PAS domain S-box protein [Tenuifilaceae bacterium]
MTLLGIILYSLGALLSIWVLRIDSTPSTLWLPLGIGLGMIIRYGERAIPGLALGSWASHLLVLGFNVDNGFNPTHIFAAALVALTEVAILYGISKAYTWFRTYRLSTGKLQRIVPLSLGYLVGGLLFALINSAFLTFNGFSLEKSYHLLNTTLGSFVILLLIPPLIIVPRAAYPISYNSYKVYAIIILTSIVGALPLFPFFENITLGLYYAIVSTLVVFISTSQNFRIYTIAQAIIILFTTTSLYASGFFADATIVTNHLLLSASLILISYYINIKIDVSVAAPKNQTAKTFSIGDEAERQTEEYRRLTEELFVEVDRRAKAEKELVESKRLLAEAQEYSGIATWEYSLSTKRFRWISYNKSKPILNFDIENETLNTFAKRLHPDDLYALSKLNRMAAKSSNDFEIEIRIKNDANTFDYYLLRGRKLMDQKKSVRVVGLIMNITERKKFEQQLLEKEQKYQALFDSNIDPVCVIYAGNYKIKEVNPAFEKVYEYSRSEIVGKSYIDLSAEPNETKDAIAFGRRKGYYRIPHRVHLKKSGQRFLIEANLMKYKVNGEDMLFIITHDITERKKAENLLAEREQKFRAYFDSDLIGMAEISISKEIQSLNNKLIDILGYPSIDELMRKSWEEITHPDDREVENRLFNGVITHSIPGYTLEKKLVAKNGSYIYCNVYIKSIKTTQGNISHMVALVDDISDRKRTEQEIKESRAQLRQSQAVAKLGSIRLQPGSSKISLSDEAYVILGYKHRKPSLVLNDITKMIMPGDTAKFISFIKVLEHGEPVSGDHEIALLCTQGEVKYLLINFGLSLNDNKQVKEILITLADITRIKKAEMALHEANALKDQLFSIIGHDLRSPISSINQLVEILNAHWSDWDEETIRSTLDTLKTTSSETYKLLVNLLEWANAQRTDSFKPTQVDLSQLVDDVLTLMKSTAKGKRIAIEKNLLDKAMVFADEEMIKTALRNLIGNSIKFTPSGGKVIIDMNENSNTYLVSVYDNGVGIAVKDQQLLFDNAATVTTPGTNNEKGTGLGLKLVKKFIDKNSGEIFIESEPGVGSKFSFTLPKVNRRQ